MYKDYLNRLVILNYEVDEFNKKDYLYKSNEILDKISLYIDRDINLKEKFNCVFKQNKRLF